MDSSSLPPVPVLEARDVQVNIPVSSTSSPSGSEVIAGAAPLTFAKVNTEGMPKKTRQFYARQNEAVEGMEAATMMRDDFANSASEVQDDMASALASRISLTCNVVLLVVKLCVVVWSGSLAIIASALDSVMDLVSGAILWYSARMARNATIEEYPVGAGRAEPVAMVCFSTLMFMASLQVVVEAVQRIAKASSDSTASLLSTLLIVGVVLVKVGLFILCRFVLRQTSTTVALAADHRNDVLTNSFGLIFFYLGSHFQNVKWLDPTGALLFSLYVMYSWVQNGLESAGTLVGRAADPSFVRQVTAVCMSHSNLIQQIDTVRAFSLGNGYVVEVDIVVAPETTVKISHDIGEALQHRLENLQGVERAIIHIDYETDHNPVAQTAPGTLSWRHRR